MDDSTDLSAIRREYRGHPLDRESLAVDPIVQFQRWLDEALHADALDATAMSLATVSSEGRPRSRAVLLKTFDHDGFVFYTNLESRKARDIGDNPHVALHFLWPELVRQVCIEGSAAPITKAEAVSYFALRPRGSQIGAWVSAQSSVISARSMLEAKFEEMKRKFANHEVPIPSMWGGYRVRPQRIEFWQGRPNRLHDRFQYIRGEGDWQVDRLAP